MTTRFCQRCGVVDISAADYRRKYCIPCAPKVYADKGGAAAQNEVFMAVSRGDLPPVATLTCTDCGDPASKYDHRDYNKPLDVQPVCNRCNQRRGAAIPKVSALVAAGV